MCLKGKPFLESNAKLALRCFFLIVTMDWNVNYVRLFNVAHSTVNSDLRLTSKLKLSQN